MKGKKTEPKVPTDIMERYEEWRLEANIRHDEGEWRLIATRKLTPEVKKELDRLIEKGSKIRKEQHG